MIERIDSLPTNELNGYKVRPGKPLPFGVSHVPEGLNFSVYSSVGHSCTVVLFNRGEQSPFVEIAIPDEYRIGSVFCIVIFGLDYEQLDYGFRVDGPNAFSLGHRCDSTKILMDPYARTISGRDVWGELPDWANELYHYRSRVSFDDFDWGGDTPLRIPPEDLIIYETHVRGFTRSESSLVSHPGTYAGLAEKIPYLKKLGINAIELMPVFEFDEFENSRIHPETSEQLYNYWGYSTLGFFAPKAAFASTGRFGMQVDEFKQLIKQLHANGIEVILDVVFNHTAEGNEHGPTFCFKGLDNKTYYMLTPEGYYFNFSGTGNTLNCNNPVVRSLVLDCLRYWASEYHIDGFRFDLASILGRDPSGAPLSNPPLLESLAFDPILSSCNLIAEAWDAGGLYQVGSFPAFGRWAEWNGIYRDSMRRFLKGDSGQVGKVAQCVQGSPDLYRSSGRAPATSINFITCHDGFTLADLVSFNDKHNEANGESNRDGSNDNHSWNCGAEGWTEDPSVLSLRQRQMMNAFALLLTSRGIPMFVMGDEVGRSQQGNNNAYCIDSELSWFDWGLTETNTKLLQFASELIKFRLQHPSLRVNRFDAPPTSFGLPSSSFHGAAPWSPNWSEDSRQLAWMFAAEQDSASPSPNQPADVVYVMANMAHFPVWYELPSLPTALQWKLKFNTGDSQSPFQSEPVPLPETSLLVGERSVIILTV